MQKKISSLTTKLSNAEFTKRRCLKINKYFKKHGTLEGFALTDNELEMIKSAEIINIEGIPFPSWVIQNLDMKINEIRRLI